MSNPQIDAAVKQCEALLDEAEQPLDNARAIADTLLSEYDADTLRDAGAFNLFRNVLNAHLHVSDRHGS